MKSARAYQPATPTQLTSVLSRPGQTADLVGFWVEGAASQTHSHDNDDGWELLLSGKTSRRLSSSNKQRQRRAVDQCSDIDALIVLQSASPAAADGDKELLSIAAAAADDLWLINILVLLWGIGVHLVGGCYGFSRWWFIVIKSQFAMVEGVQERDTSDWNESYREMWLFEELIEYRKGSDKWCLAYQWMEVHLRLFQLLSVWS